MAAKKVVVIYHGDDWYRKIPFSSKFTRKSFQDWHERGLKNNVEFYRASLQWFDEKKHIFKKSWAFRNNKWIKITKPVKADVIYDKITGKRDFTLFDWKMKITEKTPIFNHPLFRTIMNNKLTQYLILGEFMPKSYLATSRKDLDLNLKKIKSKKVVAKPIYGSGGFGIIIDAKKAILKKKLSYPVLLQEFVESHVGIPGFSKKNELADLRLIYINNKLVYCLSRIAKKNSLFTNFHQGASAVLIPKKSIPKSALKVAEKIIKKMKMFAVNNYSLDFIFTNSKKPLLIETNTTPGFDLLHIVGDEKTKDKNFKEFIKIIK